MAAVLYGGTPRHLPMEAEQTKHDEFKELCKKLVSQHLDIRQVANSSGRRRTGDDSLRIVRGLVPVLEAQDTRCRGALVAVGGVQCFLSRCTQSVSTGALYWNFRVLSQLLGLKAACKTILRRDQGRLDHEMVALLGKVVQFQDHAGIQNCCWTALANIALFFPNNLEQLLTPSSHILTLLENVRPHITDVEVMEPFCCFWSRAVRVSSVNTALPKAAKDTLEQLLQEVTRYFPPLRIGPATSTAGVHYWASLALRITARNTRTTTLPSQEPQDDHSSKSDENK